MGARAQGCNEERRRHSCANQERNAPGSIHPSLFTISRCGNRCERRGSDSTESLRVATSKRQGERMYPNLKLQLWKCGVRQNRLAKMLAVDESVLSRIVNGFREPSVELQNSIASLLQCDVAWLFLRTTEIKTERTENENQSTSSNLVAKSAS
jgi:DNA-binding XRE family transcriptional regulator